MIKNLLLLVSICSFSVAIAQMDSAPKNWQNLDESKDRVTGTSVDRVYEELLQSKTSKEVVVAILDSGVDINHEDLQGKIWINTDEIPNNGIDDDGNGYIDDVNGWNFIGGNNGDVEFDNLEFTRLYIQLKDKFEGKKASEISKADKKEYEKYLSFKTQYKSRVDKTKKEQAEFMQVYGFYDQSMNWAREETRERNPNLDQIKGLEPEGEVQTIMKEFLVEIISNGAQSQLTDGKAHFDNALNYMYNLDFDSRGIVGDNYSDTSEQYYGNNHVKGPTSKHGTHVAGIVAAVRNNNLGANGIAQNVKIMSVRVVPDGDERDKDVANAIRYAADNGAQIINMSFGKSYSPQKSVVDEAALYAQSKGVLLIHAAGNSSKNIDKASNFPNDRTLSKKTIDTWIEVGSSSHEGEMNLASRFTNYGKKSVDLFAPGSDIYNTTPENTYESLSGTSMAAPVVSGVAALLWSYYPELTAEEVKEILIKSALVKKKKKVIVPGASDSQVKFKKLSRSGSIVNAYNAFKLAEEKY